MVLYNGVRILPSLIIPGSSFHLNLNDEHGILNFEVLSDYSEI